MTPHAVSHVRADWAGAPIVMFDPGYFLPRYIHHLSDGLLELGVPAEVVASPPLFGWPRVSGGCRTVPFFFPFLRGRVLQIVRHRRLVRQALKALAYPFGLLRTWRALGRRRPGVLHVQWAPVPLLDGLLLGVLQAAGWRVVYTLHDPMPRPAGGRLWRQRCRLLMLSDAVVVHTPQQARELMEEIPEIAGRIQVIPHGAEVSPVPSDAERRSCRRRLGLEPHRQILLFFGMLKRYKGIEYILAALPAVAARFPRIVLVIAGEPFVSVRALRRRIAVLGLDHHVVLRPGFVSDDDAAMYFRAADLLVAPYLTAGVSGVVVQAQGHALPVIVTRVGGLPAFVEEGLHGFVVPPREPRALADAICRALSEPEALADMGRRGRARLARDNRWSDVARQTAELYGRLLQRHAPSAPALIRHAEEALWR